MGIMAHHARLGLVDSNVILVDAALTEYDERLFLERHQETGDWVVMIKMERPTPPYPVLGLGREVPPKDMVMQKVYESDAQRNDIRDKVNRANKARDAAIDHATSEKVGEAAELVEYISRKTGRVSEYKSYRKQKRNDGH